MHCIELGGIVQMAHEVGARAPRKFGIEEEYLLLDPWAGTPSNSAARIIAHLPTLSDRVEREFLASQLETATEPCLDARTAEDSLTDFRSTVATIGAELGVAVAGTGLPPSGGDAAGSVTPKPRYQVIDAMLRNAAAHQYSTGTHVHVEVPSRDVGVEVLARLAPWAPVLLAMTANSPLWNGEPTGFASWRHIMGLTWPVSGYPPPFADAEEYSRVVDTLVSSGILIDPGMLTWTCRLSERYPTVELRIADAQLCAADSVAYATIVRALVDRAVTDVRDGVARRRYHPSLLKGATWAAARDGLEHVLVDPLTGKQVPAFELVDRMLDSVAHELASAGDDRRVEAYVARLRATRGPAQLQLLRFADQGIHGLIDLYQENMGVTEGIQISA